MVMVMAQNSDQQRRNEAVSRMLQSNGSMFTIFSYFKQEEITVHQGLSKDFYHRLIPRVVIKIELPRVNLLLERSRKQFYIGFWREKVRQLPTQCILKIGDGEGEVSPLDLGFSEVYF